MNPELPQNPREEMELRVTALLLGELSADEAAVVREAIAKDPELAKLHDDLKQTIQLVRQAETSTSEPAVEPAAAPKLSTERREKLLAQFKTVTPKEFSGDKRRRNIRLLELAAVLAIVALLAAVLLPAFSNAKSRSKSVAVHSNLR